MVCKVELRPSSPNWILMAYKQRAAVAGWVVDERTATFTVQVSCNLVCRWSKLQCMTNSI